MAGERWSDGDLDRFRHVQSIAYLGAVAVAGRLRVGDTEKTAAAMLRADLLARGVEGFFHAPFAWFGDRTAFRGFRTPLGFFPTDRRLAEGDPVILDVAPIIDGFAADIGYAFAHGRNALLERMTADLEHHRSLILAEVRAERTMAQVYEAVDRLIASQGHENRHSRYPNRVLGHKVGRMRRLPVTLPAVGGFDLRTVAMLASQQLESFVPTMGRVTPFWNRARHARVSAEPGIWAMEPHIGHGSVGAKWEELLVVTDTDAFWLDDDLPHIRRWRAADAA